MLNVRGREEEVLRVKITYVTVSNNLRKRGKPYNLNTGVDVLART